MTIEIDPDPEALAAAATLHCDALPGSLISRIGPAYTHAFYRFAASSSNETVFVMREANATVVAGAVLSLDPAYLTRHMLWQTPLLWHLASRPLLALALAREALSDTLSSRPYVQRHTLPEVIAIFTKPEHRSRGAGKALLRAIEAHLIAANVRRYVVRTSDDLRNRATAFYEREGFEKIDRVRSHGNEFYLMAKDVDAASVLTGARSR